MTLTPDDIVKSISNFFDKDIVGNKARKELASKVADEHLNKIIEACCITNKTKAYEMLMEYLVTQEKTLRGNEK